MIRNHAAGAVREQAGGMSQQAVDVDFIERICVKRFQKGTNGKVKPENAVLHELGNSHRGNRFGNGSNLMNRCRQQRVRRVLTVGTGTDRAVHERLAVSGYAVRRSLNLVVVD